MEPPESDALAGASRTATDPQDAAAAEALVALAIQPSSEGLKLAAAEALAQAPQPSSEGLRLAAVEALALPQGRFVGIEVFRQHLRAALAQAAAAGWRELLLCDATFADWPLGERAVVESLQTWAQPGRRLRMLACRYDEVVRRQARFVVWRQRWSHLIECHACRSAGEADFPSLLLGQGWFLQRLDLQRSTGVCGTAAADWRQRHELLEAWLRKSAPAFAATTLGL